MKKYYGAIFLFIFISGAGDTFAKAASFKLVVPDKLELVDFLRKKKFKELDKKLTGYHKISITDKKQLRLMNMAFGFVEILGKREMSLLHEWVKSMPESTMALLSRAWFYEHWSYESRGTEYASDTSKVQFENMNRYFNAMEKDVNKLLTMDPNMIEAYFMLMKMSALRGSRSEVDKYFNKAMDIDKYHYMGRYSYMSYLSPRWGGSFEEMEAFASKCDLLGEVNPKLLTIRGFIYDLQGDAAWRREEYRKAIHHYTTAISYGDVPGIYQSRGRLYFFLKKVTRRKLISQKSWRCTPRTSMRFFEEERPIATHFAWINV